MFVLAAIAAGAAAGYLRGDAAVGAAKNERDNLYAQAQDEIYNAKIAAEDIERNEFASREVEVNATLSGEFTQGARSLSRDTGIASILEQNKQTAIANAREVIAEGSRKARRLRQSGDNTVSAARDQRVVNTISGGLSGLASGIASGTGSSNAKET